MAEQQEPPRTSQSVQRSTLLYLNANAREERLEEKREHLFRQQYPFRPETTPASKAVKRKTGTVFGDLYENAREKLAEHTAKREQSDASMFRPSVTKLADSLRRHDATPAHEHLYRQHAERESKLAARREAEAASVTFSPQVNHKSSIIAEKRGSDSCVERLYAPDALRKRNEKREAALEERFQKECPFQPKLVAPTGEDTSKQEGVTMEGQIWRRSEQLSQARTARMKEMQRQREEEAMRECTFKPRITPMPDGKRPTSKFRIARDSTPRDDQQAKDGFAELHPFKPQLNATSQRLAASRQAVSPSSGVFRVADRRLQAEKREEIERLRKAREKQLEEAELAECTFRPRISRGSPASPRRLQGELYVSRPKQSPPQDASQAASGAKARAKMQRPGSIPRRRVSGGRNLATPPQRHCVSGNSDVEVAQRVPYS